MILLISYNTLWQLVIQSVGIYILHSKMGGIKSITHSYTYNQYLFWYIEKNDVPNIQKVLQKRPDLIDQSLTVNFKTTPLHRAAVNGNLKLAELFLDKYNASIDFKTTNGETALIGAIKKNKIELIRFLLSRNANADEISGCGLKPIEYAILAGFYEAALIVYQKMKTHDLKEAAEYEIMGKKYQYRYVNYEIIINSLKNNIPEENVPDFLTRPKKIFQDPVVDPRQTWKKWILRNLQFKDPPLCQRSELPEQLQPQNRKFGKVRHYISTFAMTHLTQKPSFQPQNMSEAISNHKLHQKGQLKEQMELNQVRSV